MNELYACFGMFEKDNVMCEECFLIEECIKKKEKVKSD